MFATRKNEHVCVVRVCACVLWSSCTSKNHVKHVVVLEPNSPLTLVDTHRTRQVRPPVFFPFKLQENSGTSSNVSTKCLEMLEVSTLSSSTYFLSRMLQKIKCFLLFSITNFLCLVNDILFVIWLNFLPLLFLFSKIL